MKLISQYIIVAITGLLLLMGGCQKQYELGELKTPSNVNMTYEIVGVDDENPHGDGSGLVNFSVTADNAITYIFDFGDGRDTEIAGGGKITYRFATNGLITYNVTVSAVGTGGITSTKTDQVEVYSEFEDNEALEYLTGGSSKTWYWAADQPAHVGLGPVSEDYGNLDYTWPNWWQIAPFDADKACMYDAELVFTKAGNDLIYEQISGLAFVPAAYADVIGIAGDVCHGDDVVPDLYGEKNVTFIPSSSKAAMDGGYRGTTMSFSDGGFMCWWVGTGEYDIIEVTDNVLRVRIMQDETYAWYHIFTSEKPVQ